MANIAIGRTNAFPLQNKSGGALAYGDVVILDPANPSAVTTTTTVGYFATTIGVVLEPNGIAIDATGMIGFSGYVPRINLSSSASLGDFFKTHSVTQQAVRHVAPINQGDFGMVLTTGANPPAVLYGQPNATPSSGGLDLWTEVVKTADQDVTNSATLANDDDLLFSYTSDSYMIELFLLYSGGSAAADYKLDWVPSSGTYSGWVRWIGEDTTADAIYTGANRYAAASTLTAFAIGTDGSHTIRHHYMESMLRFSGSGTFNFKFAQNVQTGSVAARTKKGSILRYRKLPVT